MFGLDLLYTLTRAIDDTGRRWMPHEMTPAGVTAGDWILANEHNAPYTLADALAYARYLHEANALRAAEEAADTARAVLRAMTVSGPDDEEIEDDLAKIIPGCSPELYARLAINVTLRADEAARARKAAQAIVAAAKERYWAAIRS